MYEITALTVGALALAGVALPLLLRDRLVSYPMVLVVLGAVLAWVAFEPGTFDPVDNGFAVEHLAEFAVIVALTGLGLSIDRRISWRGWSNTWRLLAITMPLTIAAAALLSWGLVGLFPAAAMLFAAAIAPTDPVIANDVQIGPPTVGADAADERDEVRFALTSESSLNDSLAFPFTYLAVHMALQGTDARAWFVEWLLRDVLYRIVVGVGVGWLLGWVLARVVLRLVNPPDGDGLLSGRINPANGLLALAITLISYNVTELIEGYGFLAVFVTALVIRDSERTHEVHDRLHEGAEQLELLGLGLVLLGFGAALADGVLRFVSWEMIVAAVLLVVVVRPVAGLVGLFGTPTATRAERVVISVFGIRGLGSIYYVAYGLNATDLPQARGLWALTSVTILVSLLLHGLGAKPAMRWLDVHSPGRSVD